MTSLCCAEYNALHVCILRECAGHTVWQGNLEGLPCLAPGISHYAIVVPRMGVPSVCDVNDEDNVIYGWGTSG